MKKFLRKTFIFLLSFGMILSGLTTVNASDVNGDDDIMNYVVGGSGTYDDPYILTGDNQYKDMFDARVRGYSDPNLMPLIDFSGVLTGASHYNQNNGGEWIYKSGGPDTTANNALRVNRINYVDKQTVFDMTELTTSSVLWDDLADRLSKGLFGAALKSALLVIGVPASAATAASMIFKWYYGAGLKNSDRELMKTAKRNGWGILQINYQTSWNGSWYVTSCLDYWSSYPTAREPGSYYGIGTYTSS